MGSVPTNRGSIKIDGASTQSAKSPPTEYRFKKGHNPIDLTPFFSFEKQKSLLSQLPKDILEAVLSELALAEIFSLLLGSKEMFFLITTPTLWKKRITCFGKNAQKKYDDLISEKM